MTAPTEYYQPPNPHPDAAGYNHHEPVADKTLAAQAANWRPQQAANETPVATMSRVALRIIDRETGNAYSADELLALLAQAPYDGEPVNYVAATPATATLSAGTGTLEVTAVTAGDIPLELVTVAGDGPNAALEVEDGDGAVTVTLATDAGDHATMEVFVMGGTNAVLQAKTAGASGNGITLDFTTVLLEIPKNDTSAAAPDQVFGVSGRVVTLPTTSGTVASMDLTESSTGAGSVTVATTPEYAGSWANAYISAQILIAPGASLPLSCVIDRPGGAFMITVYLATDTEGLPLDNPSDDVADAINAAIAAENLSAILVATDNTSGVGVFNTVLTNASMSGGTAPEVDTTGITIANVTDAIVLANNDLEVLEAGSGNWVPNIMSLFTEHGGENVAPSSTLAQIKTAINTHSALMTAGAITNGTEVAGEGTETLTGGTDATPGTPAKLGRIATDGTSVWTALKDDQTITQDGWVKTYDPPT